MIVAAALTAAALMSAALAASALGASTAWSPVARTQDSAIQLMFTDNLTATHTSPEPTAMEQTLLDAINGAQTSIDASIYDFNRDSVRDALIDAWNDYVEVRIVTDDDARISDMSKAHYDALAAAGIPIVTDGAGASDAKSVALADGIASPLEADAELQSGLMHDKYFIIDGRRVWTGSVNMSDTDLTLNHNNAMLVDSQEMAAHYQADFDQMFGGSFGTAKTASLTTSVPITSVVMQVYFSPQDQPTQAVIDAINGAQDSIDFTAFYFTETHIGDALLAAKARGVAVRGLWDYLNAVNEQSEYQRLCDAGLSIKVENTSGKMHNKLAVIDAGAAAPVVVAGSLNWTASAGTINNENTVLLKDSALAGTYEAEFQKMWSAMDVTVCGAGESKTYAWLPIALREGRAQPDADVDVRIQSIVYDPDGSDVDGENVTIVNLGTTAQVMTGWKLSDEADTTFSFPSFSLAGGGTVRVWVKAGVDTTTELFWGSNRSIWNNDGDTATLTDSSGAVVDACTYTGGAGEALCN